MSVLNRTFGISAFAACAVALLAGCATGRKNLQPINEQQKSEIIKGLDVVEQPALEPEWADYVKDRYPNWRQHYWVDRGNWGNRGYLTGRPDMGAEPVVVSEIQPLPPAPPAIEEVPPPKIETPERPTRYVVKRGDSLWKVAGKVYHNPLKWHRIYQANKDKIKNPNRIYPNQVLTIPWE